MSRVEFRILGPLEVEREGRPVALGGGQQRALLALLLVHANQRIAADRLVEELWGEPAPARAVKRVQVAITRLRKALRGQDADVNGETLLRTVSGGYLLAVGPGELDADVFGARVEDGRRAIDNGEPARAAEVLREALGLWRGQPLAEVAYEPFAQGEIRRLEELQLAAIESRVEADLQLGRHASMVGELEALVAGHPTRERLAGQRMLALYRCGRQAEALEAYRDARRVLVAEIGVEPGRALQALQAQILAQSSSLELGTDASTRMARSRSAPQTAMSDDDPALIFNAPLALPPGWGRQVASSDPPPGRSLPLSPTPTAGRDEELVRLRRLVQDADVRLVTLVGPGGVGKTRVAVELARQLARELADGTAFVSLAALAAPEDVAAAIAADLGLTVTAHEAVERTVARYLSTRELLLVLDNFEHLLAATPLIVQLVTAAPAITVVATSREPLRIHVERTFQIEPLKLPPAATAGRDRAVGEAPAVALFVTAAAARAPSFSLTPDNADAVVRLCRRLDGLPLALELAAGRTKLLSPAEILRRLDHDVSVLGRGPRDAPIRHQTLSATLEWSYRLLSDTEQAAFSRLSVVAGGCGLEAAERITGADLDVLQSLVEKHMLIAGKDRIDASRLSMLQTIREFAREQLARRADARDASQRHYDYFVTLAEHSAPDLERSQPPDLVARLTEEIANMRGALRWAIEQESAERALRIAVALERYWNVKDERQGARWLRSALALGERGVPAPLLARALNYHAGQLAEETAFSEAEAAAQRSIEMHRELDDTRGLSESMTTFAWILLVQHRLEDAFRAAADAAGMAREADDPILLAHALEWQAAAAPSLARVLSLGAQAAAQYRALGNDDRLGDLHSKLAYAAICHGEYDQGRRLAEEGLRATSATETTEAAAWGNLALAALMIGDAQRAAEAFRRELTTAREHNPLQMVFEALGGLAAVEALEGRERRAALLLGAADALATLGHAPFIAAQLEERFYSPARARCGEDEWSASYAAGQRLTLDQAVHTALTGENDRLQ